MRAKLHSGAPLSSVIPDARLGACLDVIPDARAARDRESRTCRSFANLLWIPDQAFGLSGMTLENAIIFAPSC
jgi:hypothetical protein